jgi:hypothetical protein
MRRLMVSLLVMVGAALAAGIMPVAAQERVTEPPTLAPIQSYHIWTYLTFNDMPMGVCRGDVEGANRSHAVCRDLFTLAEGPIPEVPPLIAGQTFEAITYDGTFYGRLNEETTWTATPIEGYDPNLTLIQCCFTFYPPAIITRIGAVDFEGTPTTHYQWWATDAAANTAHGGLMVYDQFVTADGRVVADQLHSRGTFPILGAGQVSLRWTYHDINTPITVSPPPADRVQAGSIGRIDRWLGSRLMQMPVHGTR